MKNIKSDILCRIFMSDNKYQMISCISITNVICVELHGRRIMQKITSYKHFFPKASQIYENK